MKIKSISIVISIVFFVIFYSNKTEAQERRISDFFPDIKILASNGPAGGYFFMGSKGLTATDAAHYITIIDNCGTPVFFRKMNKATSSVRLLEDGRIAYLNGVPRKLYFLNEMLEVTNALSVEGFKPNGHDWDVSDSGNILLMGQASSVKDMSLIVAGGDTAAEVLDLIVQEFDPEFNLLYTWNSANHFQVTDGNENSSYLDFTEKQIDYVHANGISIDSDTSFLISCRHMDEITKVDRRTGDIIWRLGGKNNQFQFVNDDIGFSHQHGIRSLGNGNILLFDNGNLHFPQLSSAVEYKIDEPNKTATMVERYYRNPAVYSNHSGAVQPVFNGNKIIDWGPYWPSMTEFHSDGTTALEWDFTSHSYCPHIEKYLWQTKVFETSPDTVDFGAWESDSLFKSVWVKNNSAKNIKITTVESRTNFFGIRNQLPVNIAPNDSVELGFWYNPGNSETGFFTDVLTIASDTETQRIARQVKVAGWKNDNIPPSAQITSLLTEVPLSSQIKISFTEPVKRDDGIKLDFNSIGSYILFRKNNTGGEDVSFKATISTDLKIVTIIPETKLEKASNYYLSILNGLSDYSGNQLTHFETVISTVLTSANGIVNNKTNLFVFPNPATSKIIVSTTKNENGYSYKIYNSTGILIQADRVIKNNSEEIDISGYNKGIYFLVAEIDGKKVTKKIIKY